MPAAVCFQRNQSDYGPDCNNALSTVPYQVDSSLFLEPSTFSQPAESLPAATSSVGSTERASTGSGTILDLAGLGSTTEVGTLLGLTVVILAGIAWF